jgi:hypothetical protein
VSFCVYHFLLLCCENMWNKPFFFAISLPQFKCRREIITRH